MPGEMKIDAALADLEAGKFSFRMADTIKNHVNKLESELEVTRSLHGSAVRELKLQEYANWRLQALLTANILTEKAYRKMRPIAIEIGKYFSASLECAGAALERATANLKSGKFQSQLVDSSLKLYEFLRANAPTEETFREIRHYAIKMGEFFQVLKRHAAMGIARATAYLSDLHKTSE
jgi:predicted translin family RNA/ssDNA-binding protein